MFLNTNFLNLKKTYIIFFLIVLFIILTVSKANSSIFKVSDIEITEPFNSKFKKKKIIDKAIKLAFEKLLNMSISSYEKNKITGFKVSEIRNLIDSFNIKNEKFINNTYNATFEINFNKQNTFLFIEKRYIFPSAPIARNIIVLPILVDIKSQSLSIFNQNPFFTHWNSNIKNYHLIDYILPAEDIDVVKVLNDNISKLEDYDFSQITKSYNTDDYIICLIYKQKDSFKIFSKIKFNEKLKIKSKIFPDKLALSDEELVKLINEIKQIYEDEWKEINKINRSVKLPINLSMNSLEFKKNDQFERFLSSIDQVSKYSIKSFNNNNVNYKIIFNGSPKQFLSIAEKNNFIIDTAKQIWKVE